MNGRAFFATLGLIAGLAGPALAEAAGDPAKGQEKAALCTACHGADGNSPSPAFPNIAGQYEDYLYRALLDYQAGRRKNPIMAAQVENLSAADMRDLAAWFASQRGLYQKR